MKHFTVFLLSTLSIISSSVKAQVQVSNEPRHKKVVENKYLRLLDVRIRPHDTTFFHIHSTPSVFLQFTNTTVGIQIKGEDWVKSQNNAGSASYRSFLNDTLVHRVSNWDTVSFHVTDMEILSAYNSNSQIKPLPFTVLFENEKTVAYRLTDSSFSKQFISNRGPMVAELVAGDAIIFHDTKNKKSTNIKAGKYLYIKPGSSFYLSATGKEAINLVLFEIK